MTLMAMDDRQPLTLSDPDQQRARHRLALEFGSRDEFEDPRFGYRRYVVVRWWAC